MAIGTVTVAAWETTRRSPSRHLGALLRAGVLLVLLTLTWMFLVPVQLGGTASYVVTEGTSMLPDFEADGLVVTRAQDDYRVGEIVAYHNRELDAVVMHRIVEHDGNRFVLQGDNNDYRDTFLPTEADLIGKQWVHWPGARRYLRLIRDPLTFAVLIGVVAVVSLRVPRRSRRRRLRHGS